MNNWMVMSATELDGDDFNQKRCFERNALDLTEAEARAEADRRTAVERSAGHRNVTWFPLPM